MSIEQPRILPPSAIAQTSSPRRFPGDIVWLNMIISIVQKLRVLLKQAAYETSQTIYQIKHGMLLGHLRQQFEPTSVRMVLT